MSAVPRPRLSLVIPSTLAEHVRAWLETDKQLQSNLWQLAEIAVNLTKQYGEADVESFAREVKRSPQYVYQLAQTHNSFPQISTRVESLSFSHHKIAARYIEPPLALKVAREKNLSVRQLEVWIEEQEANVKQVLARRDSDRKYTGKTRGRGATTKMWEGLEGGFLAFSDEQLRAYALSICTRTARALHLETVEQVLLCDDVGHYIGERKYQLKFKNAT